MVFQFSMLIIVFFHIAAQAKSDFSQGFLDSDERYPDQNFDAETNFKYEGCEDLKKEDFVKTTLNDETTEPMELQITNDGNVYFIERRGGVFKINEEGETIKLAQFDVYLNGEDGLLGLALDPAFDENQWMYLFYSPEDRESNHLLSRFTVTDTGLDRSSETLILEVPIEDKGGHAGGGMVFDTNGNLFLGTGDNRTPINYPPERFNSETQDIRATSGNTNHLSGKILRIKPKQEGGYSIPEGNLFPADDPKARPEIYIMGCRNPFRLSIDPKTNVLIWGDYAPDRDRDSPEWGTRNYYEFSISTGPGNHGWPYFIGNNSPYRMSKNGPFFDPDAPVNQSPRNTGHEILPPAQPPTLYTPGSEGYHGGPVYYYDPTMVSDRKFPPHFNRKIVFYQYRRAEIHATSLLANNSISKPVEIHKTIFDNWRVKRPLDYEFGPHDGALYIAEYAGNGNRSSDTQIARIDYVGGCHPEAVSFTNSKNPYRNASDWERAKLFENGLIPYQQKNFAPASSISDIKGRILYP